MLHSTMNQPVFFTYYTYCLDVKVSTVPMIQYLEIFNGIGESDIICILEQN